MRQLEMFCVTPPAASAGLSIMEARHRLLGEMRDAMRARGLWEMNLPVDKPRYRTSAAMMARGRLPDINNTLAMAELLGLDKGRVSSLWDKAKQGMPQGESA